ncbi:diguanylate cyclase (plasmid) [Pseudorhodobacter turbinis]|uniref:Diguanylate cyclase n=1 Tax=Pseudorhodobacter turbinis TaxID=2500533 RepID=A0A4P8EJG9_9RHOB|nr:dihydroneopterin aldolase [Pseudorhodobacter turbinis]QCO56992.1 diguanylate cyclase [Pseudorhodobacter turbinis]
MTVDTSTAFAHPEQRAAAMAGADPLDRISVRDYVVEVEIGAFAQERGLLQKVRFNIVVEVAPVPQPLDDDVDLILSYDRLTEAVTHELQAERINLLETLAERVALRILAEPQALRAFVRIEKVDRGPYDLGVEIVRSKAADVPQASAAPRHVVGYLAAPDRLADVIAAAAGAPLILVVADEGYARPSSPDAQAQRRIDLLAMEQAAWAVAGQDARCFVVATRTELDWALRNEQISLWAPARMVADAVPPPQGDALALAVWLSEQMQAVELLVAGAAVPLATVPVRALD